jgi:hypothetical protein
VKEMFASIPDSVWLMLLATIGTWYRQLYGFYSAKQENPEIVFDYRYVNATAIATIAVMTTMAAMGDIVPLTWASATSALASGMGIQEFTTQACKLTPTPGELKNENK